MNKQLQLSLRFKGIAILTYISCLSVKQRVEKYYVAVVNGSVDFNFNAGNGPDDIPVTIVKGGRDVKAGKSKAGHIGAVGYLYDAAAPQLKDDSNITLFFLEKDLVLGKTFDLLFTKDAGPASFLPHEMADSIPFSSRYFTNILDRFLIKPKSEEANLMRKTIAACEAPRIPGEEKYCPTSLESMIDFSTKILAGKKNVKAVSTESDEDTQIKNYKIEDSVNSLTGDEEIINAATDTVACHKRNYVYAVFYCHSKKSTKVYMVPLKSDDGKTVKAIAICHMNTSNWNPKHLAFQVLKFKPGTVPVCHFPAVDTVVWYPN